MARKRPRKDMQTKAPGWMVIATGLAWSAALVGAASVLADGMVRRAGALFFFAAMLAAVGIISRQARGEDPDVLLGGPGYQKRLDLSLRTAHGLANLGYNVGIMIVVYAIMVRIGILDRLVGAWVFPTLAVLAGAYFVTLIRIVTRRAELRGGLVRTWYTKVHGVLLLTYAVVVLGLAAMVLPTGRWNGFGVFAVFEADVYMLMFAGLLGASTQLFLASRIPTMLDIINRLGKRKAKDRSVPSDTPPVVYAMSLAILATGIVGLILLQFDLLDRIGAAQNERVILVIALFPLGLAVFFLFSALALYRESRRGLYKKQLTTKMRNDLIVFGTSTVLGLTFMGLLVAVVTGRLDHIGRFEAGLDLAKDLTMLTIVATAGPIGIYLERESRRLDALENRLPDFLNDLAENRRAGLPLHMALQNTAQGDFGPLSPEIEKMANQVSWGVDFSVALQQFSERVKSKLVERSTSLIVEASRTGGSVADVLKAAAHDARELKALEAERRSTMQVYLLVLYVVFGVFMMVIASMDAQFLPEVASAGEAAIEAGADGGAAGLNLQPIDLDEMRFVYFNASMVQAIGNGIVGGVLTQSRVTAGFRHVMYMAIAGWIVFRLILPVIAA